MLVMMFILDREPTSQLDTKDPPMPIFFQSYLEAFISEFLSLNSTSNTLHFISTVLLP